jgi:hypothetical protein
MPTATSTAAHMAPGKASNKMAQWLLARACERAAAPRPRRTPCAGRLAYVRRSSRRRRSGGGVRPYQSTSHDADRG